jgi:hypothetical protein
MRYLNHVPNIKLLMEQIKKLCLHQEPTDSGRSSNEDITAIAWAAGVSRSTLIDSHSTVPYLRAFDVTNDLDPKWERAVMGFSDGRRPTASKFAPAFCKECVRTDNLTHGMPYWRRVHQLPKIDWCPRHGTRLTESWTWPIPAFDHPPGTKEIRFGNEVGAQHISEASALEQNYWSVAHYVFQRQHRLSFHLVRRMIRLEAFRRGLIDASSCDVGLTDAMIETYSAEWLIKFYGRKTLGITRTIDGSEGMAPTKDYVLLLSFLFGGGDEVCDQLERLDFLQALKPNERYSIGDELSEDLLYADYVRTYKYRNALPATSRFPGGLAVYSGHGLPDITALSASEAAAVRAFFDGVSIEEACTAHSVQKHVVEEIIRSSGARFASTLALSGFGTETPKALQTGLVLP